MATKPKGMQRRKDPMSSVSSSQPAVMPAVGAVCIIRELETGVKCLLEHDSSTNTLLRRYRKSKELLHR